MKKEYLEAGKIVTIHSIRDNIKIILDAMEKRLFYGKL